MNRSILATAAGVVLLAAVPLVASKYYLTYGITAWVYTGLAIAWNIIAGYTGYVSFGHVAFFGVGAYTAALLMAKGSWSFWAALPAAGLAAAAFAVPLGYILLRLKGPYFTIAMLGLNEALRVVASTWESLTGGGSGVHLPPEENLGAVYLVTLLVCAGGLAATWWIDRSPFGLKLIAIREDEQAAEVLGVDTVRAKVTAFAISAAIPGLLGAAYAWYLSYIDPQAVFRGHMTLSMIIMTMLGGAGTVWGPVIGGISLSMLTEALWARYPELYLAVFGTLIAAVAMLMPRGLIDLARRRGWIAPRRSRAGAREVRRSA